MLKVDLRYLIYVARVVLKLGLVERNSFAKKNIKFFREES
jgi:hypothetical protein